MSNIEIVLNSDYTSGSGDLYKMYFGFDDNEIAIITTNKKDNTQHDFALTKPDYLFLREQFDKHFGIKEERE